MRQVADARFSCQLRAGSYDLKDMNSTTIPGTHAGAHADPNVADDFGDARAEFHALLSGCGVYDLGWRSKVALTGSDRVRWLNGMITNNVRDLATGHGVYAFLLNAQGHIQADLYAFQRGDSLLVDFEGGLREKVLQLFDHYIIADDVEVSDVSGMITALGLTGPESRSVLERAGIAVPELTYLQFAEVQWQKIGITVLHSGEEARESWQIWVAPEHVTRLWDALMQAGAMPTGTAALNFFRIAKGIPQFGQDIRERDLPQETGQMRALNFTKGCYLGQEIVERIRSRGAVHREFGAFTVEGELPAPGTKIEADGKDVGEVTTSAILSLPGGDRAVALGYLRRAAAGKKLSAAQAMLIPSSVPFAP
jgi:folate-binding protein YgfZ